MSNYEELELDNLLNVDAAQSGLPDDDDTETDLLNGAATEVDAGPQISVSADIFQPAVVLVLQDAHDECTKQLLTLLKSLKISTFEPPSPETQKRFIGLYLTHENCEHFAERYNFHLTFDTEKSTKPLNRYRKIKSSFKYGSQSYSYFSESNYSAPFRVSIKHKFSSTELYFLHSTRVQAELIYNILRQEHILSTKTFKISDHFIPHSSDISVFREKLSYWPTSFPLKEFRDYFGEELAFVYAWNNIWRYYGLVPICFAAFIVLIYGAATEPDTSRLIGLNNEVWFKTYYLFSNRLTGWYVFFMLIWVGLWSFHWKRTSAILALQWGTDNCSYEEESLIGKTFKFKILGRLSLPNIILSIIGFVFAASITLGIFIVTEIVVKVKMNDIKFPDSFSATAKVSAISTVCSLFYTVLNTLFGTFVLPVVARFLTDWENHKFRSFHENSMIMKFTGYYLMSSYLYLLYLIFGVSDIVSTMFGLDNSIFHDCTGGICSINICEQLVMQIVILRFKIIVKYAFYWIKAKLFPGEYSSSNSDMKYIVKYYNSDFFGDGDEFWSFWMTERVLMYGYVVMFSFHMPVIAIIAGLIEAIVTTLEIKILMRSKRPEPRRIGNIKQWDGIIYLITIMSIIVNAYAVGLNQDSNVDEKDRYKYISLVLLPIFILLFSLIQIQENVAGDDIQTYKHRQFQKAKDMLSHDEIRISTSI